LNFIPSTEAVPVGEVVYTAGTDQIYPKGIPIGTVLSSRKEGVYWEIQLRPAVDYYRLEEVAVVLSER
jgi:rod shape-determining protein MreC